MKAIHGDVCMKDRLEDVRKLIPVARENIEMAADMLTGGFSKDEDYSKRGMQSLCEGRELIILLAQRLGIIKLLVKDIETWVEYNRAFVEEEILKRAEKQQNPEEDQIAEV